MRSRSPSSASNSSADPGHGRVVDVEARFHQVHELAQAHRARHPRAALERVERSAQLARPRVVARRAAPCAHALAGLRIELRRLFEKDRQHLRVDVVAYVRERILRHLAARGSAGGAHGRTAGATTSAAPSRTATLPRAGSTLRRRGLGARRDDGLGASATRARRSAIAGSDAARPPRAVPSARLRATGSTISAIVGSTLPHPVGAIVSSITGATLRGRRRFRRRAPARSPRPASPPRAARPPSPPVRPPPGARTRAPAGSRRRSRHPSR